MLDLKEVTTEVVDWVVDTLGSKYMNKEERAMRLLEEAIECFQSAGLPAEKAHLLVGMVYDKPRELYMDKEVAGTLVCLTSLSYAFGVDIERAYLKEREYRHNNQDLIRTKHRKKTVKTEPYGEGKFDAKQS